ncbi:MAG: hypothetical protein ACLT33_05070 [Lachnospira pectinoschiza]
MIKKNGYVSGDCFTYASVDRAPEGIGAECIWVDNQGQGLEIIAGLVILEQAGIILIQQECMMDLNVLC